MVEAANSQTKAKQKQYERRLQAFISLGLDSSQPDYESLESEMDSYLAVANRNEWDSIAYWEV